MIVYHVLQPRAVVRCLSMLYLYAMCILQLQLPAEDEGKGGEQKEWRLMEEKEEELGVMAEEEDK